MQTQRPCGDQAYVVEITEVSSGRVALFPYAPVGGREWHDIDEYLWADGNYSCDCNRRLFFDESLGTTTTSAELNCGDSAFVVRVTGPQGEVYRESAGANAEAMR
jgi:hypothetical protein